MLINPDLSVVYRQIADQIIRRVEDGSLPSGSRLPTVRALAEQFSVTRVTAHKAYTDLQSRGWVDATVGRGTFVSGPEVTAAPSDAGRHPITADGIMGAMSRFRQLPGVTSLAMAEPDPALYPARAFLGLCQGLVTNEAELFQYGSSQGEADLRWQIASLLADRGIKVTPEEILVTSSVTQGLSLVTAALCHPGDKVIVEDPT